MPESSRSTETGMNWLLLLKISKDFTEKMVFPGKENSTYKDMGIVGNTLWLTLEKWEIVEGEIGNVS